MVRLKGMDSGQGTGNPFSWTDTSDPADLSADDLAETPAYKKGLRWRFVLVLSYTASVMAYIAFGGLMLVALEAGPERDRLRELKVAVDKANLTERQRTYLADLGTCQFYDPDDPDEGYYWTYEGAFLFALTVVTTIGYGDRASPVTHGGRAFTCVYAVFGIAIVLSALMRIAALLMDLVMGLIYRGHHKLQDMDQDPKRQRRYTRALLTFADSHMPFLANHPAGKAGRERRDQEQIDEVLAREGAVDQGTGEVRCTQDQLHQLLSRLAEKTMTGVREGMSEHVFRCAATEAGYLDRAGVRRAVQMWRELHSNSHTASLRAFLASFFCTIGWVAIWCPTFSAIEEWSVAETLWFSFITLTTIGLGDYAPTHRRTRWALMVFILPGLGLTGWSLGAFNGLYLRYARDRALRRMHERGLLSLRALEAAGAATELEVRIKNKSNRMRGASVASSSGGWDRRQSIAVAGWDRRASQPLAGRRRNVSFAATAPPQHLCDAGGAGPSDEAGLGAQIDRLEEELRRLKMQHNRLVQNRVQGERPPVPQQATLVIDDWDYDSRSGSIGSGTPDNPAAAGAEPAAAAAAPASAVAAAPASAAAPAAAAAAPAAAAAVEAAPAAAAAGAAGGAAPSPAGSAQPAGCGGGGSGSGGAVPAHAEGGRARRPRYSGGALPLPPQSLGAAPPPAPPNGAGAPAAHPRRVSGASSQRRSSAGPGCPSELPAPAPPHGNPRPPALDTPQGRPLPTPPAPAAAAPSPAPPPPPPAAAAPAAGCGPAPVAAQAGCGHAAPAAPAGAAAAAGTAQPAAGRARGRGLLPPPPSSAEPHGRSSVHSTGTARPAAPPPAAEGPPAGAAQMHTI